MKKILALLVLTAALGGCATLGKLETSISPFLTKANTCTLSADLSVASGIVQASGVVTNTTDAKVLSAVNSSTTTLANSAGCAAAAVAVTPSAVSTTQ